MSNKPSDIASHIRSFFCLKRIIRNENADIIHCPTQVPSAIARMAAGRTKAGIIYTSHGFHFYGKASLAVSAIKYIEKKLAQRTDCIITINNDDYNNALKLAYGRIQGVIFPLKRQESLYAHHPEYLMTHSISSLPACLMTTRIILLL